MIPHFLFCLPLNVCATVCTLGISEADYPPEIARELETPCRVMNRVRNDKEGEREMWRRGGFPAHTHTPSNIIKHTPCLPKQTAISDCSTITELIKIRFYS